MHQKIKHIALVSSMLLNSFCLADGVESRSKVEMPAMMQQHMMANMRDHLAAINEILLHLANADLEQAADVAESRLGMSSLESHGASHMSAVMPLEMRKIGISMHRAASQFALKAQQGDRLQAYAALGAVTSSCVACHADYRIR